MTFSCYVMSSCGLVPGSPPSGAGRARDYFRADYGDVFPESRSFGEMHNLFVAEMTSQSTAGEFKSIPALMTAAQQGLLAKFGAKSTDMNPEIMLEVVHLLHEEGVADPYIGGNFDAAGFVELYQSIGGLPDLDAQVLTAFLDLTSTMDFADQANALQAVDEFCAQYGVAPNDGTFIGLVLDTFVHSLDYWTHSEKSALLATKFGGDTGSNTVLGDTLVGGLAWLMFGPVVGYIAGGAWSYVFAASEGGCTPEPDY